MKVLANEPVPPVTSIDELLSISNFFPSNVVRHKNISQISHFYK